MNINRIDKKPITPCMKIIIQKTLTVLLLQPNDIKTLELINAINIIVKIKISLIYKN